MAWYEIRTRARVADRLLLIVSFGAVVTYGLIVAQALGLTDSSDATIFSLGALALTQTTGLLGVALRERWRR